MIPALCLLAGLLLGAFAAYWLQRAELRYLRAELAIAQDRLLHAWRDDKAVIPPRPIEVEPPKPLPPELAELVTEWESPEARATMEARLRHQYFERGWGVKAILRQQENEHP